VFSYLANFRNLVVTKNKGWRIFAIRWGKKRAGEFNKGIFEILKKQIAKKT
jgi:hypothetical protein